MKIFRLLPVAAIAFAAVSCQTNGSGSLGANASQTDSLMNYLGEINGADYLRQAMSDTTLKEPGEKQAYLNGVRAGLAALKEGDENYNRGVMLGVQMAMSMISYSEQVEIPVDKNVYLSSLSATILADTLPNTQKAQMEMNRLMQEIQKDKEERDKVASQATLKGAAEAAGLPKIDDDLYGKVTSTTDSALLNVGDEVTAQIKVTKENGEPVQLQVPAQGKIGNKRFYSDVVSNSMLNLKSGETGEFMTTAHALFGNRIQQMGLKPSEVLKMTVTATLVPKDETTDDKK